MNGFNILVVDDEPLVVRALRRLLKREGFTVEVAHSGEEALERMEHFAPDIILSDFRMPGMTGSELMKEVKRRHPQALRLILSGYADFKSVVDAVNEGEICRYLSKPWDDVELVSYLRSQLRNREVMARLYQPFRTGRPGLTADACPTDKALVVKVALTEPPFAAEQAVEFLERFTGPQVDGSLADVGGLLERHGGTLSFEAEVGGPQRLRVELPVPETPPSPVRRRLGEA